MPSRLDHPSVAQARIPSGSTRAQLTVRRADSSTRSSIDTTTCPPGCGGAPLHSTAEPLDTQLQPAPVTCRTLCTTMPGGKSSVRTNVLQPVRHCSGPVFCKRITAVTASVCPVVPGRAASIVFSRPKRQLTGVGVGGGVGIGPSVTQRLSFSACSSPVTETTAQFSAALPGSPTTVKVKVAL